MYWDRWCLDPRYWRAPPWLPMRSDRHAALPRQLGRAIRVRRAALGATQETLALEAGLSPKYVGQVERGEKVPTLTTMAALAGVLGCSAWELVRDAEEGLSAPRWPLRTDNGGGGTATGRLTAAKPAPGKRTTR